MARKHIWFYLKDEDGNPIEGASINLYLKDTTTEATVYESRTASAAFAQSNILSDEDGYFEFYIGDQFEDLPSVGYNANQIFELHWASTEGTGFIDNFQIFDKIYIVDETNSSSTAKDKMISNEQAYKWDQHVLKVYTVLPHGIEPVDELKRTCLTSLLEIRVLPHSQPGRGIARRFSLRLKDVIPVSDYHLVRVVEQGASVFHIDYFIGVKVTHGLIQPAQQHRIGVRQALVLDLFRRILLLSHLELLQLCNREPVHTYRYLFDHFSFVTEH